MPDDTATRLREEAFTCPQGRGQLADFSEGFVSATLAADGTLTITSFGNYFSGKHVHQYLVTGRGFLAKGSHILYTPAQKPALKLHRDSRQLRDAIKEVQRRDKSVEA